MQVLAKAKSEAHIRDAFRVFDKDDDGFIAVSFAFNEFQSVLCTKLSTSKLNTMKIIITCFKLIVGRKCAFKSIQKMWF